MTYLVVPMCTPDEFRFAIAVPHSVERLMWMLNCATAIRGLRKHGLDIERLEARDPEPRACRWDRWPPPGRSRYSREASLVHGAAAENLVFGPDEVDARYVYSLVCEAPRVEDESFVFHWKMNVNEDGLEPEEAALSGQVFECDVQGWLNAFGTSREWEDVEDARRGLVPR